MEIIISHLDQLRPAARQFLTEALPGHSVIAFYGSMGAGKTTFIKALCEELGVADVITSPTFAIVNEYGIDQPALPVADAAGQPLAAVYHFDFYRIRRLEEVFDMGYEDYFYAPRALCLLEWPELVEELLPENTLRVTIAEQPDGTRRLVW